MHWFVVPRPPNSTIANYFDQGKSEDVIFIKGYNFSNCSLQPR